MPLLLQLVLQRPALRDGGGDEDEVVESVVDGDAIAVHDAVPGREYAAVTLPQDVLHVLAHLRSRLMELEQRHGTNGPAACIQGCGGEDLLINGYGYKLICEIHFCDKSTGVELSLMSKFSV